MASNDLEILIESFKQNHHESDRLDSIISVLQYLSYTNSLIESANTATEQAYAQRW